MNIAVYQSNEGSVLKKISPVIRPVEGSDITIIPEEKRQTIRGFGGAFTESAAHVFASFDTATQEELLDLLFTPKGLDYNLGRTTIGSCDFSLGNYVYATKEDLSDFTLAHDEKEIFPFLRRALERKELFLLASPWSPLPFFKTNNELEHGGKLLPEYYGKAGEYIALYVKHCRDAGIPIQAITLQNEPEAKQTWESCLFTPKEELAFAKEVRARIPDLPFYGFDHNRDHLPLWAETLLGEGGDLFEGLAYHWYDGNKNKNLALVKERYPDKELLFTEGCVELLNLNRFNPQEALGRYKNGLRYFRNYLLDSIYGSSGFIDWNLLLDEKGGPNHVGNYCEAPIMREGSKYRLNPSYYAIYHFSHFIAPGARVLKTESREGVLACGFENPDGSYVIELLNEQKEEESLSLRLKTLSFNLIAPKEAMTTVIIQP